MRRHGQPISTIGVTTADRPQLLERCLLSVTRQVTTHGSRARIIVVDASKSARNESLGRSAASSVQLATGRPISFIGRAEKLALRQALRSLCDDSLLEFAFRPCASGNRNIILLLTSGEHVLFVDDDVVCAVWSPRSLRRVIALGGHAEERDIAFYAQRGDVCERLEPANVDLLQAHDAVLGRTIRSLVTAKTLAVDKRRACGHLRAAARGERPARVRMTFCGIAGDAGVSYPDRLLLSGGTWRTALASSRRAFKTALTFREVCKVARRYTVMHEVSCMTACMGLSNTTIAPPFLPVGRNEDGLFGATLSAIDLETVSCHVPYAVLHASNRPPRYSGKRFPSTSETRTADLLISLINRSSSRIRTHESRRRLVRLGDELKQLAALRTSDFVKITTLATLRTREREVTMIESALENHDAYPSYWRDDLRSFRTLLVKNAHKPTFLLPLEFHGARTTSAGYDELRQFVDFAGELYVRWPALWTKAKTRLPGFAAD